MRDRRCLSYDGRPCSVEGCDRPASRRTWCALHYARWRRTGNLESAHRTGCDIDGCDGKHYGQGFCRSHYMRKRHHGDPVAGRITPGEFKPCSIPGCNKRHSAKGLCRPHYKIRWSILRDTRAANPVRHYPAEPLRAYIAENAWALHMEHRGGAVEYKFVTVLTDFWVASHLGINGTRWAAEVWTEALVDKVCTFLHIHPVLFYPSYLLEPEVAGAFASMLATGTSGEVIALPDSSDREVAA